MLHWSTKYCQEDAEISDFRNLILPTDRNCPWGENRVRVTPASVTLDLKKFTCHQTLVHCLMDSFSSHTLVQLLYNLHCQDVEIQNITPPQSELSDPINSHHFDQVDHFDQVVHYMEQWSHSFGCLVPGMFICITSSEYNVSSLVIIMNWFYAQLAGLVCGYDYWRRCGSMLEQSRWLRSIDIVSGRNSILDHLALSFCN